MYHYGISTDIVTFRDVTVEPEEELTVTVKE